MNQDVVAGIGVALVAVNFLAVLWLGIRVERRGNLDAQLWQRVALLEQLSVNAPTHRDLEEIRSRIGTVAMTMAAVSERLLVNTEMTRTIQKHLMEDDV